MIEFSLLDGIVQQYQFLAGQIALTLLPLTLSLATALFTINFSWDLGIWALQGTPDLFPKALKQLIVFVILYGFILTLPFWLSALIGGFRDLAFQVSGVDSLKPSAIYNQGINLSLTLYDSWSKVISSFIPQIALFRIITFWLVMLAFTLLGIQLAKTLIEISFALGGLMIFMAFAAHRATFGIAEGFIRYVVELGIRLYVLFLVVAVARNLAIDWDLALQGFSNLTSIRVHLSITASAILLPILAWILPKTISSRLISGFRFSRFTPLGGPTHA